MGVGELKSNASPSYKIDSSHPRATFAMLCDFLSPTTIMHYPANGKWHLRGFYALPTEPSPDDNLPPAQVLYICRSREAHDFLVSHPLSPFIIVHDGDTMPAWMAEFADRILLIKKDRAYSFILFMVQEFFLNMSYWTRRMDDIALNKGTFQDLVDASEDVIENFIALTDNANVLLAYSKKSSPIEKMSAALIEKGFFTQAIINAFELDEPSDKNIAKILSTKNFDGDPLEIYLFPIWHMGTNFGNCMIVCDKMRMTDGLKDYLQLFLDWVARLCERVWRVELETKSPINMFFINLIAGKAMSDDYIKSRISLLNLPEKPQFKLLIVKSGVGLGSENMNSMMESSKRLNSSRSIPFRYDGNLLTLLYASSSDENSFSIPRVSEEVKKGICDPYKVYVGTSQVFERIEDLDMAYGQALLACDYKEAIDIEGSLIPGADQKTVYAFEDALIYCLIDQRSESDRFKEFVCSYSFLDKIIARDKSNGTNDFALLWVYLRCDCNISTTAKQLFMHRNTVIYHIEKIKETFMLDFSDKGTRDRCLIDYKIKFLSMVRRPES